MTRVQHGMVGVSTAIRDLVAEALYVAPRDLSVLIIGESGVGKGTLARYIHENSQRHRKPMASINCAAVNKTVLESDLFGHSRVRFTDPYTDRDRLFLVANGGTILLDEVGEMGARMQALLLRALEKGEIQRAGPDRAHQNVDVRIISVTTHDLLQQTRDKAFRQDLYYRLNVVKLVIPPLRDRVEDIRILFDHFVQMCRESGASGLSVSPEVYPLLEAYAWPGNIRELHHVAVRAALRSSGVIRVADLPKEILPERKAPAGAPGLGTGAAFVDAVAADRFDRMVRDHESFWTAVYEPFMTRELSREVVRAIVYRGLYHTKGSYRALAPLFNLQSSDYTRLLSFLQQHDCHLPLQPFRVITPQDRRAPRLSAKAAG